MRTLNAKTSIIPAARNRYICAKDILEKKHVFYDTIKNLGAHPGENSRFLAGLAFADHRKPRTLGNVGIVRAECVIV